MVQNWLTYWFYKKLGNKHFGYFERYSQGHNPFDNKKNTKQTFSSAMQHFWNTLRNRNSLEKLINSMAAVMPNTAFIGPNQPKNQTKIQLGAQPGTSRAWVITLQKTLKYCTYCKQDYHTKDKCYDKYPHLKKAQSISLKLATKRQKTENQSKMI